MKFSVVTIFPQIIWANLEFGILGKAIDKEKIEVSTYDPRDYSKSPTKRVDDKPFGGGSGMVMEAGPIIKAVEEAKKNPPDLPKELEKKRVHLPIEPKVWSALNQLNDSNSLNDKTFQ